ncbi:MAG: sugar kinase [Candidatus Odinarchaeota archaeon]
MFPDIISLGELLVDIIRKKKNIPHRKIGAIYRGPFPSGAPANYVNSAARMGSTFSLKAGFIGVIGDDEFGKCIIEKLQKDNVDISQIRVIKGLTTGIAFNQYNSDGSRKFIFAKGAAGKISPKDINADFIKNAKNLHITGSALYISKTSCEACYKAVNLAKSINPDIIISFDPNLRLEMLSLEEILKISKPILETTTILLPSGKEAELLAGINDSKVACRKLLTMGPKIIILKQGKAGCIIFTKDNQEGLKVESFKVIEKDPTGAGDAFGGAFIVGFLAGWDLEKAALFANAVGALKVESIGPMPDTSYEDVINFMKNREN